MRVREIKKEDIKVGLMLLWKDDYNNCEYMEDSYRTIASIDVREKKAFFDNGLWDFFEGIIKGSYMVIEEDKPTGIPTFDGDINKQVGGDHYSKNDPIQFAKDNYPPEHLEGFYRINVDKYMARYDKKNGIEDIKKAKHYIEMLLDLKEQQNAE